MRRYRDRNLDESVGRIVLAPFRVMKLIVLLPLLVIWGVWTSFKLFFTTQGGVIVRLKAAFLWPFAVLAMNDFMSLGGLDNPMLTRITDLLRNRSVRRTRKRRNQ